MEVALEFTAYTLSYLSGAVSAWVEYCFHLYGHVLAGEYFHGVQKEVASISRKSLHLLKRKAKKLLMCESFISHP